VGVLVDAQGRFLLTSRPVGKVYAGYWEFPGGKLEGRRGPLSKALRRELHEEIGITIGATQGLARADDGLPRTPRVRLNFCKVFRVGPASFEMREGQTDGLGDAARGQASRCCPARSPSWSGFAQGGAVFVGAHAPGLTGHRARRGLPSGAGRRPPRLRYTWAMTWLDEVKWDRDGPRAGDRAGARHRRRADVRVDETATRFARTAETQRAVYWSRSRQKAVGQGRGVGPRAAGCTSCASIATNDVVLLEVTQLGYEPGIACHTGRHSCFFQKLVDGVWDAGRTCAEGSGEHLQMSNDTLARLAGGDRIAQAGQRRATRPRATWRACSTRAPTGGDPEEGWRRGHRDGDGRQGRRREEDRLRGGRPLVPLDDRAEPLRPVAGPTVLRELERREGLSGLEEFALRKSQQARTANPRNEKGGPMTK